LLFIWSALPPSPHPAQPVLPLWICSFHCAKQPNRPQCQERKHRAPQLLNIGDLFTGQVHDDILGFDSSFIGWACWAEHWLPTPARLVQTLNLGQFFIHI
jgi:hypothetical protein